MSDEQGKEQKNGRFFQTIFGGWSDSTRQSSNARGRTFDNISDHLVRPIILPGLGEDKKLIELGEVRFVSKEITDEVAKIRKLRVPDVMNDLVRDIKIAEEDFTNNKDKNYKDKLTGKVFTREAFAEYLENAKRGTKDTRDVSQVEAPLAHRVAKQSCKREIVDMPKENTNQPSLLAKLIDSFRNTQEDNRQQNLRHIIKRELRTADDVSPRPNHITEANEISKYTERNLKELAKGFSQDDMQKALDDVVKIGKAGQAVIASEISPRINITEEALQKVQEIIADMKTPAPANGQELQASKSPSKANGRGS